MLLSEMPFMDQFLKPKYEGGVLLTPRLSIVHAGGEGGGPLGKLS